MDQLQLSDGPVTRDGQPFTLGQPLVTYSGNIIQTSPETHELSVIEYQGEKFYVISRKNAGMSTNINCYYSSETARLKQMIADLELDIRFIQEDIDKLRLELEKEL